MSNWQNLSNPDIQNFIAAHAKDDVRNLALKKSPHPDWPYSLIMDQIKSRQKAAIKMPSWLAVSNIIFPPSDIIEQASSEATARYKSSLVSGKSFTDLTGGSGLDSAVILDKFETARIIDLNPDNAAIIAHNIALLSDKNVTVENTSAEAFIQTMQPTDLALIDPQRRENKSGKRGLYKFEDCSPNIFDLLPTLKNKAQHIMIKTSPMLDIDQGIIQIENTGLHVRDVHVVEWQGDCKELLFILTPDKKAETQITAVAINDDGAPIRSFTFTRTEENMAHCPIAAPTKYLYEPSPAFMKAGAFNLMATQYGLHKLHHATHLYSGDALATDFPGRIFEITQSLPVNKKAIKPHITNGKANIAVRNFPMRPPELAKKLGLKDGGDDYLFACKTQTESKEQNALLLCKKLFSN